MLRNGLTLTSLNRHFRARVSEDDAPQWRKKGRLFRQKEGDEEELHVIRQHDWFENVVCV
jgi:hypothetical protein